MRSALLTVSAVLGFFTSGLSAMAIEGIKGLPANYTVTSGIVSGEGNLDKREDTPKYCKGEYISSGYTHWYVAMWENEDTVIACIMGPNDEGNGEVCSKDEWWPSEYVDDILAAGSEQITKDGLTKTTTKGFFTAQFEGYTTAIPEREPMQAILYAFFQITLPTCELSGTPACNSQNRHYYYNYKGEVIGIAHRNAECGGIPGIAPDRLQYCPGKSHCGE